MPRISYLNPEKKASGASKLNREIAEKRRLMYDRYGGLMSPVDVAREIGYCARSEAGDQFCNEHGIPAVKLGPRKRGYETDLVAKTIVQLRGMC